MSFAGSGPSAIFFFFSFFPTHLGFRPAAFCFAVAVFGCSYPPPPFSQSHGWRKAFWRLDVEAPGPPSSTGMPAGLGSLAVYLLQRRDNGNLHRTDRVHIGRAGTCTLDQSYGS